MLLSGKYPKLNQLLITQKNLSETVIWNISSYSHNRVCCARMQFTLSSRKSKSQWVGKSANCCPSPNILVTDIS